MDLFQQFFLSDQENGTNFNKNFFSQKNEPHTDKLCFPVGSKYFPANSQKNSLFNQNWRSQKEAQNKFEIFFLNSLEKGQIQRKIRIFWKQPFLFKARKMDKYKQKLFFSTKWATYSSIMLSCWFEAFLG